AELGVAEHIYRFHAALEVWEHPFWREWARDDLDEYCGFVREETDLRLGIEADYVPGREDRIANLLEQRDWDYVVGSVHFLRDRSLDTEDYSIWGSGESAEKVWRRYFETVAESALSGLYDIVAHPDLVKVWGEKAPKPDKDPRYFYEPAVEAFAEAGVAVELSTAGLRKPVGELYPARPYLEMILDAGCPIALSSDAHVPDQLGFGYEQALELLEELGVGELYPARPYLEMILDAGCPIALSSDAHVPDQLGFRYEQALELLEELGVGELAVFERRTRRMEPIG
ncbi:MAG TPA: histidinol-phosphatase, partial [Solirubrobacteraceae bacterium]|nr:histidinol-phosphatase [Solirubrobacteraceae bacterium]